MGVTITCYWCDGSGSRDCGTCYICDGTGALDAARVAYLIEVAVPNAIALFERTGGEEGVPPSLAEKLLEPLWRLRERYTRRRSSSSIPFAFAIR
jgi:hypothetical protein